MAGIRLTAEQAQAIAAAAIACYPRECCGVVLGRGPAPQGPLGRDVAAVVPLANAWATEPVLDGAAQGNAAGEHSDRDRYAIAPADLLRVQKAARSQGLDILGIYHSHPDHPAVPSECDRRLAWPVYSYLIVSVVRGQVVDLQSWRLNDHQQFEPEPVKMIGSSANKAPFLS